MTDSVVVTGRATGDGECWCLEVTEDEYRRVVGEDEYLREKTIREVNAGTRWAESDWRLYPDDLFRAIGQERADSPITFRLSRETAT